MRSFPAARWALRRALVGLTASAFAGRATMQSGPKPDKESLDSLTYKEILRGQLAPPLPQLNAEFTKCGAVVFESGVAWQAGAYGSLWLRLGLGGQPTPSLSVLSSAVDEALERAKSSKPSGAAVYVGIHEFAMDPGTSGLLRSKGFRYHHFRQAPPAGKSFGVGSGWGAGEHVYYRWNGNPAHDMVPSYATSIEGVGGLILSPDETKVLLIWEYGNWKPISGAVDDGECSLNALKREAQEETGVQTDPAFQPVLVGGWQMARARDDRINDNFKAYVLRAASERFEVDGVEIAEARWFDVQQLLALYATAGHPDPLAARSIDDATLPEGRQRVGTNTLAWMKTYKEGGGLPMHIAVRPTGAEWLFFGSGHEKAAAAPRSKL